MKSVAYTLIVAASLAASSAFAADMAVKSPPPAAPAPPPSPWDIAITAALMNDYNFRGVTQSNHRPSTQAGFEPRYNFNSNWQGYVGISGESIDFPNRAAAEIDFYGGIRPTFDKLALDFGIWEYYYPDGQCFNGDINTPCAPSGGTPAQWLPNGNAVKGNVSFTEFYAKGTYTVNDNVAFGLQEWYSPSVLNSGAPGWFTTGNLTLTAPTSWFSNGLGAYVSGDVGYWDLGTSDNFYCTVPIGAVACGGAYPGGVPYTSYWTWDAGLGFTWKVFTLDLRYYDTNLTKAECNVFTSDQTASFSSGSVTPLNPGGLASNWCGADFVAKLSVAVNLSGIK
jgi:uncharacterized protein (TIGR02001 family)